jgi:hypothetical protein
LWQHRESSFGMFQEYFGLEKPCSQVHLGTR